MADNFINSVQVNIPGTNFFDMSHDVKMSGNMGLLYPCGVFECLPNDRWRMSQNVLTKFAPLISPVMHRVNVTIHNWKVPSRLLWDHWEEFISQKAIYEHPYVYLHAANSGPGTLADYLGFPHCDLPGSGPGSMRKVSAFPFAAYQFIYHERYRDQNLIPEFNYKLVDGNNSTNLELFVLRHRAWMHDLFTSAAPDTQVGDPVVIGPAQSFPDVTVMYQDTITPGVPWSNDMGGGQPSVFAEPGQADQPEGIENQILPGSLYADTSILETQAVTINDWRLAEMLQKYKERLMRVGRRFNEWLRGVWGVTPQDARLQQPEYIGGTITPVIISEIMNTTGTEERPQGDRAGVGMAVNNGREGYYHCQESGWIISIYSCTPVTAYQQGIPKMYLKFDPLDYYTPDLAQIGEQPIMNQEVYCLHSQPASPFGYLPAYYDYRLMLSRSAGDFKTNLSHWTMTRIFSDEPELNQAFIECDPTDRVWAVQDEDTHHLWIQVVHSAGAIRPVSKFGIPGI